MNNCKDCAHHNDGKYTCIVCQDNNLFENKYEVELAEIKKTAERRNTMITREGLKLDIHRMAARTNYNVWFEESLNNSIITCRFCKIGSGCTRPIIIMVDLLQAGPNTIQAITNKLLEESVRTNINEYKTALNSVYGVSSVDRMGSGRISYRDYYSGSLIKDADRGRPRVLRTSLPGITNVIFNNPATIVFWVDGTKTVVKAQDGEKFDPEKGLAMAISKKALGNEGNYYNQFEKWLLLRMMPQLVSDRK